MWIKTVVDGFKLPTKRNLTAPVGFQWCRMASLTSAWGFQWYNTEQCKDLSLISFSENAVIGLNDTDAVVYGVVVSLNTFPLGKSADPATLFYLLLAEHSTNNNNIYVDSFPLGLRLM